ncbi:MAG: hypothetical protein ABIG46_02135 [Candidatus Omnitrophota bacterium]|nr:hypothetical protein [Candidatus Omnitrophota bacterium]
MKKYLENLPQEIKKIIKLASLTARDLDVRAYLVGGFVRDLLIGEDNYDLDITVVGEGIIFAEQLGRKLGATKVMRHRRFGTATLLLKDGQKIDIATARKESYAQPAALPVVEKGSLKEDLFRRDFTINAMAISINADDFGNLIDYFKGRSDLKNKSIRVLHNLSFIDDPTRIYRAVRFEQRFNFKIEPLTHGLLKLAVEKQLLSKTEPQRMRDELILILKEAVPFKYIRRLNRLGALKCISPGIGSLVESRIFFKLKRELKWFDRACASHRGIDTWLLYFMALIKGLSLSKTKDMLKKLVFGKGEEKRVLAYKELGDKISKELSSGALNPAKIFYLLEPLSYEMIIFIRANSSSKILRRRMEDFFCYYHGLRLHITGDDLRRLGVRPGPKFKLIFDAIFVAKLNSHLSTKAQELTLAKRIIRKGQFY